MKHKKSNPFKFPGLIKETLKTGVRYRVRKQGNKNHIITMPVPPEHEDFARHYKMARLGFAIDDEVPAAKKVEAPVKSMEWLVTKYLEWMTIEVERGNVSPKTLKKRKMMLGKLVSLAGRRDVEMPSLGVIKIRDRFSATPVMANDLVTAIRVMYAWALERGMVSMNPAQGIKGIAVKSVGAINWSMSDFNKFCAAHPKGSTARLCLHLLAFTGCRIGDARLLCRDHIVTKNNIKYLEWQPEKRGSSFVSIPLLPQLAEAILETVVVGPFFLMTSKGKPFLSADAMSAKFGKWCNEAGLKNRSAHGIRKSVGSILAEAGCTQYQIMSVLGHSDSKTSEIYTKAAERPNMAAEAIDAMREIKLDKGVPR